jgi:hypothetical protein
MSRDGGEHPRGQVMLYDLHFRQHYALSTWDDPGNAKWKQRSSCAFCHFTQRFARLEA